MKKLQYCKKCILPNTRPNISYNYKKNLCSVCGQITKTGKQISWKKRKKEFEKIISKIKKKKIIHMIALFM